MQKDTDPDLLVCASWLTSWLWDTFGKLPSKNRQCHWNGRVSKRWSLYKSGWRSITYICVTEQSPAVWACDQSSLKLPEDLGMARYPEVDQAPTFVLERDNPWWRRPRKHPQNSCPEQVDRSCRRYLVREWCHHGALLWGTLGDDVLREVWQRAPPVLSYWLIDVSPIHAWLPLGSTVGPRPRQVL